MSLTPGRRQHSDPATRLDHCTGVASLQTTTYGRSDRDSMCLRCAGNFGEISFSRKRYFAVFQPVFPKFANLLFSPTAACTHGILQWATFWSHHASNYLQIISWCSNWENRWKYRHIPGPAYSFPLGNMATVRKKMQFRAYTDWQAQYGDTFKMFFLRQPVVVTTGEPVFNTAQTEHKLLGHNYN